MDDEQGGYFVLDDPPHLAGPVSAAQEIWRNLIASVQVAIAAVHAAVSPDERRAKIAAARHALQLAEAAHDTFMDATRVVSEFHEQNRGLDLSKHKARMEERRELVRQSLHAERAKLDALEAADRGNA